MFNILRFANFNLFLTCYSEIKHLENSEQGLYAMFMNASAWFSKRLKMGYDIEHELECRLEGQSIKQGKECITHSLPHGP